MRVVCRKEASEVVRTILARDLGSVAGIILTGITSSKSKGRKQVVMTASVIATPVNDKAIQEVVSRLLTEPGVRSASWEKVTRLPE